jgi:hypothetical protein
LFFRNAPTDKRYRQWVIHNLCLNINCAKPSRTFWSPDICCYFYIFATKWISQTRLTRTMTF